MMVLNNVMREEHPNSAYIKRNLDINTLSTYAWVVKKLKSSLMDKLRPPPRDKLHTQVYMGLGRHPPLCVGSPPLVLTLAKNQSHRLMLD
jgi:hypothetical protein